MDSGDEEYYNKILKTKGKTQKYLQNPQILELVHRNKRQGKCVGAAAELCNSNRGKLPTETLQDSKNYTSISNDTWFHLAKYISPEDVKNYALVCSQSAHSVNSRSFWLHIYYRYCQQSNGCSEKWVLDLPESLQLMHLKHCDKNTLREKVIQALYKCYPPFKVRLNTPYTLESLVGRIYVSSWYKLLQSVRVMCLKFQFTLPRSYKNNRLEESDLTLHNKNGSLDNFAENWERLADEVNKKSWYIKKTSTSFTNNLDGIFILVICSKRISEFSTDFFCSEDTRNLRFSGGRELLSTDMVTKILELDFVSTTKLQTITIRYPNVEKYRVIPWWHPSFDSVIKYQ